MDIHKLKVFITVYKSRSFSKASNELRLSQPTITEHIKYLENYLGVKLFDRIGKNIFPTEQAHQLYEKSINIVESFYNLKNQIKDENYGEIQLHSSSIPGNYILPYFIVNFLKEKPNFFINLEVSDSKVVIEKIINDEGFIGFVGTKLINDKLDYELFRKDEIILVASRDFEISDKISLHELKNYNFILREEGSGTRHEIERFLLMKGINLSDLKVNLIVQNNEVIKKILLQGNYISFVSELSVRDEIKKGILKKINIKGLNIERNFFIVMKKGRTIPLRYKIFLDYLRANNLYMGN
jgi:DNA-binding transcriptional LysR family regulator